MFQKLFFYTYEVVIQSFEIKKNTISEICNVFRPRSENGLKFGHFFEGLYITAYFQLH